MAKRINYMQVIEGLIFISGNNGITMGELISITKLEQKKIEKHVQKLIVSYAENKNAFTIIETAQTYKMTTTNDNTEFYTKFAEISFNDKLSPSALETLAIVAYNQPITRFEVEEKRGVAAGHHLKLLQSRELVKVVGKSKEIGRPNLYGTTTEFLDFLGLNSLEDLPPLSQFTMIVNDAELELFKDVEDFKEIKKRLLTSENIVKVQEDIEIEDVEDIKIPSVKLHMDEEENEEEYDGQ